MVKTLGCKMWQCLYFEFSFIIICEIDCLYFQHSHIAAHLQLLAMNLVSFQILGM